MDNPAPDLDLVRLMPHQPPMLLVSRVVAAEDDGGEAEALLSEGSLFVRADGLVDEAVYFELAAQAFAACSAVRKRERGESPGTEAGFLTSVRSLIVHDQARAGEAMRIRVKLASRVEDFFVVDGEIGQDGRPLASCQVTIMVPGGSVS